MDRRFCPNTGKCGYNSVHMRGNADQRKPVFRRISASLGDHFQSNLRPTRKYEFFYFAKIIRARVYELFHCAKIKGKKISGTQNLMRLRYIEGGRK